MTGKKLQRLLACLLAVLLLSQVGAFSPAVFAADDIDYTLHDVRPLFRPERRRMM